MVELKDSSFIVAYLIDVKSNTFLTIEHKVSEMGILKFRQDKIAGKSVWISALAGFTFGGILGAREGGNSYVGPETTTGAILVGGSLLGVIAATCIGSAFSQKTKVVIKGDQSTYEKKKETLEKFLNDLEVLTEFK